MKNTPKLFSELLLLAEHLAESPYTLSPDQWQSEAQDILRRAQRTETGFDEWFVENENSDLLRDDYDECAMDMARNDEIAPEFKDWCYERWIAMQEAPSS